MTRPPLDDNDAERSSWQQEDSNLLKITEDAMKQSTPAEQGRG